MTNVPLLNRAPDRTIWAGVAWVVTGVLLALGFLYLLGGLKVATNDNAYEVVRILPGGMRSHGAIMVALGLVMAYGLLAPVYRLPMLDHLVRRAVVAAMAYQAWVVYAFAAAWVTTGTPTAAPIVWWLSGFVLSALLVLRPPQPDRKDRPTCSPRSCS